MPGPVPKRSSERRRRNADGTVTQVKVSGRVWVPGPPKGHEIRCGACGGKGVVQDIGDCPQCDGKGEVYRPLHALAVSWYRSLRTSGQAQYFEPSDWQQARYLAHELSRSLYRPLSAETIRALLAGMAELLVSEGARRRMRLELERVKPADGTMAPVAVMDDYRDALGGAAGD